MLPDFAPKPREGFVPFYPMVMDAEGRRSLVRSPGSKNEIYMAVSDNYTADDVPDDLLLRIKGIDDMISFILTRKEIDPEAVVFILAQLDSGLYGSTVAWQGEFPGKIVVTIDPDGKPFTWEPTKAPRGFESGFVWWMAAVIAHELEHVRQHLQGRLWSGSYIRADLLAAFEKNPDMKLKNHTEAYGVMSWEGVEYEYRHITDVDVENFGEYAATPWEREAFDVMFDDAKAFFESDAGMELDNLFGFGSVGKKPDFTPKTEEEMARLHSVRDIIEALSKMLNGIEDKGVDDVNDAVATNIAEKLSEQFGDVRLFRVDEEGEIDEELEVRKPGIH